MEKTEWVRVVFILCCLWAAWQDLRKRHISRRFFIAFALFGIWNVLLVETDRSLAACALRLMPGLFLLLLARLTNEAIGTGDGLFVLLSGLYWQLTELLLFLCGSILCSGMVAAAYVLCGIFQRRDYRKKEIPLMPCMLPAAIYLLF